MRIVSKNQNSLQYLDLNKKKRKVIEFEDITEKDLNITFFGKNIYEIEKGQSNAFVLPNAATEESNIEKVIKVSNTIIEQCKIIDFKSISENINIEDIKFTSIAVLLENDEQGLIIYNRIGADIFYTRLKNLVHPFDKVDMSINGFSFLTKSFANDFDDDFIFKLLAYLTYGEITEKFIPAKSTVKVGNLTRLSNNTKYDVVYANSLWKTRISTEGFKVRGHFRLQPIGEKRTLRKLIFIEEFKKSGYNRKATKEIQNL